MKACPNCEQPLTLDEVDNTHFCEECGWTQLPPEHEPDYGGAFDGTTVTSDADPGL